MELRIRKTAQKDLQKIPSKEINKVISSIRELSEFPNVRAVKKLSNFELAFRKRSGNYRILFEVYKETIEIARVLHRKDAYK